MPTGWHSIWKRQCATFVPRSWTRSPTPRSRNLAHGSDSVDMSIDDKVTALRGADLLTRADVAELLGVRHETVTRWYIDGNAGFPKPSRLGGKLLRWRRGDIDAWIDSCVETEPEPVKLSRPMPSVSA